MNITLFYLMLGIVLMIVALAVILGTFSFQRASQDSHKWVALWLVLIMIFLLGFYFTINAVSSAPQLLAFGLAGVGLLMIGSLAHR